MRARSLVALLLVAAFVLVLFPSTHADSVSSVNAFDLEALLASLSSNADSYDTYIQAQSASKATQSIDLLTESELAIARDSDLFQLSFTVQAAGLYNLSFLYKPVDAGSTDIVMGFLLDDALPFAEASNMGLPRKFVLNGVIETDERGNDKNPGTIEVRDEWLAYTFTDRESLHLEPFLVYLSEGEHTLTFTEPSADVMVKEVRMSAPVILPTYAEYKAANPGQSYGGEAVLIEAEQAASSNSIFIGPNNDLSSPYTTPYDAGALRLNTYGGQNWNLAHAAATWIVDVPADGYYTLSIRFKQNYEQGVHSHRALKINGEIPFAEAADIGFAYQEGWAVYEFPHELYFKAGENTLTLESILGDSAAVVTLLRTIVIDLNDLYQRIAVLTGSTPDKYRDYDLISKVPNLIADLEKAVTNMNQAIELISINKTGKNVSNMRRTVQQLEYMVKNPGKITKGGRLEALKSSISELGVAINAFQGQPLLLDKMQLSSPGGSTLKGGASFGDEVVHRFKRFIASFSQDYSQMSGGTGQGSRTVTVWLDAGVTGREQAQVLRELIAQDFTPKTGIDIELNLVAGAVIEATLAGKGPEVALNQGDSQPVNFAMRDALYDLTEFEDFDTIRDYFVDEAFIPYTYENGIYGIPERMDFNMMFYRKDIFEKYSIEVPQTWDDLLEFVLPVLNMNNMQVGVGALGTLASATTSSMFTNLLYQRGGQIYADDLLTTAFDTQLAFDCFITAASYYTEYLMPREYDVVSRFRTGEMPLIICGYTQYNVFAITVPELNGLWEMVPIPGTVREDANGNEYIDRSQPVAGLTSVMFKGIRDPDAGWEFMKWWASPEVQANFGIRQEATLGPAGRYNTANVKAFSLLPWDANEVEQIMEQLSFARCVPQIPGSYYTSRSLNNAFTQTVINSKDPRQMLIYWNEQINNELARKRKEFNFDPSQSIYYTVDKEG